MFERIAPHVIVATAGAELDGNIVSEDGDEGFEGLQSKPGAILDTSSPFIGALVASGIEKLSNKVTVCSVY